MTTPARNEVTLTSRGGLRLTLFNPVHDDGGLTAQTLYVNAQIPAGRIFRLGKHKYRSPGIPGPAFHLARIALLEVP